jgi:hypothetical protein
MHTGTDHLARARKAYLDIISLQPKWGQEFLVINIVVNIRMDCGATKMEAGAFSD